MGKFLKFQSRGMQNWGRWLTRKHDRQLTEALEALREEVKRPTENERASDEPDAQDS